MKRNAQTKRHVLLILSILAVALLATMVLAETEVIPDPETRAQPSAELLIDAGYKHHEDGYFIDNSGVHYHVLPDGDIYIPNYEGWIEYLLPAGKELNIDNYVLQETPPPEILVGIAEEDRTRVDEMVAGLQGSDLVYVDEINMRRQLQTMNPEGLELDYSPEQGSSFDEQIDAIVPEVFTDPELYTVYIAGKNGENQRELIYVGSNFYYKDDDNDNLESVEITNEAKITIKRNENPRYRVPSRSQITPTTEEGTGESTTATEKSPLAKTGFPKEVQQHLAGTGSEIVNTGRQAGDNFVSERTIEVSNGNGGVKEVREKYVHDATGEEFYSYREDQKQNGRQIYHFKGSRGGAKKTFIEDSPNALDHTNGVCANGKFTCMSATDDTGIRAGASYAPSQTVDGTAAIVFDNGERIKEVTITETKPWPGKGLKLFEVEGGYKNIYKDSGEKKDPKITKDDAGKVFRFTGGHQIKVYEWDGDGSRKYFQGERDFFSQEVSAFAPEGTCNGAKAKCGGEVHIIYEGRVSAQGTSSDAGVYTFPKELTDQGITNREQYMSTFDRDKNGLSEDERREFEIAFEKLKVTDLEDSENRLPELCNNNAECINDARKTMKRGSFRDFIQGKTQYQQIGSVIAQSLGSLQSYSSLSMAMCGGDYCYGGELVREMDRWFANNVLGEEYWESLVCKAEFEDLWNQPGVQFVQTPSGTLQAIASIHASHSQLQPLLCETDTEHICPGEDLTCSQDFCVDEEGEVAMGYLYSISWAVAAPADEGQTPYIDENGMAIKFNVVLDVVEDSQAGSDVELYSYNGDSEAPLQLINGDRDAANIYHWTRADEDGNPPYLEACIRWAENGAPITIANPALKRDIEGNQDYREYGGGSVMPDNCDTINEMEQGTLTLIPESMSGTASQNTPSSTSGDEEISYNSNW